VLLGVGGGRRLSVFSFGYGYSYDDDEMTITHNGGKGKDIVKVHYNFPPKQWLGHGEDVLERRRRSFLELLMVLNEGGKGGDVVEFMGVEAEKGEERRGKKDLEEGEVKVDDDYLTRTPRLAVTRGWVVVALMTILFCWFVGIVMTRVDGVDEGVLTRVFAGGFVTGRGGLSKKDLKALHVVTDGIESIRSVEGRLDEVLKRVNSVERGLADSLSTVNNHMDTYREEISLHFEKIDTILETISASQQSSYDSMLSQVWDDHQDIMKRVEALEKASTEITHTSREAAEDGLELSKTSQKEFFFRFVAILSLVIFLSTPPILRKRVNNESPERVLSRSPSPTIPTPRNCVRRPIPSSLPTIPNSEKRSRGRPRKSDVHQHQS